MYEEHIGRGPAGQSPAGGICTRNRSGGAGAWNEAGASQQALPHVTAERPEPVRLPDHLDRAVSLPQDELVVGLDPVVGRVRIPGPLPERRVPARPVGAAATAAGELAEAVLDVVRDEEGGAARPAVIERSRDYTGQVVLGGDVVDGVMDKDRVEGPREPDRAHVAAQMQPLRVERPGVRQHVI